MLGASTIILGFAVGLAFGYVSQRGRFCMLSVVYEIVNGRSPAMLRAYLLAVAIQIVALNLLEHFGLVQTTIRPFFGLATVAGGICFGLGMVLAVGCAGAVLYRLGEGKLDYVLVMIGYALAVWGSSNWLVMPLRRFLHGEGQFLTLPDALAVGRWPVIAAVVFAIGLWVMRGKRMGHPTHWDWPMTGLMLGLVGLGAWLGSNYIGHPAGLGTMNGGRNLAEFLIKRELSALDWSLFMLAGIPLGSMLGSWLHGSSPRRPPQPYRGPQALGGGLLMGLGAALVDGDNVLHGISGVPLLAASSLTFMLFVFMTTWVGLKLGWHGK